VIPSGIESATFQLCSLNQLRHPVPPDRRYNWLCFLSNCLAQTFLWKLVFLPQVRYLCTFRGTPSFVIVFSGPPSPPLDPFLSQLIQSRHKAYLSKSHFNIILPFMPMSPKWSLPFRVSKEFSYFLCVPHIRSVSRFIYANNVTWIKFNSSLCNFLHPPVYSVWVLCILPNTLFLNTLILYSFCRMRDRVSHPYETTDKIIALCTYFNVDFR
jgi:hypothetical protein